MDLLYHMHTDMGMILKMIVFVCPSIPAVPSSQLHIPHYSHDRHRLTLAYLNSPILRTLIFGTLQLQQYGINNGRHRSAR